MNLKFLSMTLFTAVLTTLTVVNANAKPDSLSGTFSTVNNKGQTFYVVYVTNAENKFIKTLRVWGVPRNGFFKQMKVWPNLSNKNVVDAVSGATTGGLLSNATYGWNGTDTTKAVAPKGMYNLVIESVRRNNVYNIIKTPFEWDGASKTVKHTDSTIWTGISFNVIGNSPSTAISKDGPFNSSSTFLNFGSTQLALPLAQAEKVSITVFSFNGKKVSEQKIALKIGENPISLDRNSVPTGIYRVRIVSGHFTQEAKILFKP